jgi:hypothetical protein
MEHKDVNKIEELLQSYKWLSLPVFEDYINDFLKRKSDSKIALHELDTLIGTLQNHILGLSLFIKQNFLFPRPIIENSIYYTKQEIANIYRVSVRTISNWILDGLQTTSMGGIKRISKEAVQEFQLKNKRKKFYKI